MSDLRLLPDEDERLLADTARPFFADRSPVGLVRDLRGDPLGFPRDLWGEVAELGLAGVALPEAHGGGGMGMRALCQVFEAAGRTLSPVPLHATLLPALLLADCGDEAQKAAWLPALSEGRAILGLAHAERGARYERLHLETTARAAGDGFILEGDKVQVEAGPAADAFVVTARTEGDVRQRQGVSAFLVPANHEGLEVRTQTRIDGRSAALLSLRGVRAPQGAMLGPPGALADPIDRVLDLGTIALAAEMLGGARAALALTLDHLKTRVQFGVVIGAFQALQHRTARLFAATELAASAVAAAAAHSDGDDPSDVPRMASLAKARAERAFLDVAKEGVQMFGGVGVTDEYDIGLYLKRAQAASATLVDEAWHTQRWASLTGY